MLLALSMVVLKKNDRCSCNATIDAHSADSPRELRGKASVGFMEEANDGGSLIILYIQGDM